jgi:DksA/TraR C4-type zinc finger protein
MGWEKQNVQSDSSLVLHPEFPIWTSGMCIIRFSCPRHNEFATDGRLLRAIEEALIRIRRGTFGVCEACKSPISDARLEAVPWTHLCRECKESEQT